MTEPTMSPGPIAAFLNTLRNTISPADDYEFMYVELASDDGATVTLNILGTSVSHCPYLKTYSPVAGQTVLIMWKGNSLPLVIGNV